MKNINKIFLLTTVLMLLFTITAINATDVDNDVNIIDDAAISSQDTYTMTNDISTTQDTSSDTKANKNIIKNNLNAKENVKSADNTHIVNNDTVDEIFGGINFTLSDSVSTGDILDFQGRIDRNHSIKINLPVNVISSTQDAVISLNTTAASLMGDDPGNSFVVNHGASGSNISGLYLENTQFWVHNAENVYFSNMSMVVKDAKVGSGVGQTSLRYCNNVTIDGCTISTENNGGSSTFVWTGTSNSTLINSYIEGKGNIGNIIYVGNPYNVQDKPEGFVVQALDNIVKNCTIVVDSSSGIKIPLQNMGTRTIVDGNKAYVGGSAIQSGTNGTLINNEIYGSCGISISANSTAYNNIVYGNGSTSIAANSLVYDNVFHNVSISGANVTFENNTVKSRLTSSQSVNIKNNKLVDVQLSSGAKSSNITANNITGTVTSQAANVTIQDNNITTGNEFTVVITADNNTVKDNYLTAKTTAGDQSINSTKTTTTLEGNTPESGKTVIITDENYSEYFDEYGKIKDNKISTYDTVVLQGTFNDKVFDFDNVALTVEGDDAILLEGYISSSNNSTLIVRNLIISNIRGNNEHAIIFETDGNVLRNVTIIRTSEEGISQEVYVTGDNNIIENNAFALDVKTQPVDYSAVPAMSQVSAITILSNGNTVQKNTFNVVTTKNEYATFDVIDLASKTECESNIITGNTINVNGTDYIYGINLGINTNKNTITSNNIKLTSDTYAAGIQIMNGPSNNNTINSNNINLTSDSVAYGILITAWQNPEVAGNTFDSNKINVTADQAYGMELYSSNPEIIIKDTIVKSNTIKSVGNHAMGIAFSGQNSTISLNTLNITGTTNETMTDTYDLIKPTTAGIILQDSKNINSYNNTINTTNGANHLLINTDDSRIMSSLNVRTRYINAYGNVNILLNSSNRNIINTQKAFTDISCSIELIDSSENLIYGNDLNASNAIGGDYAVIQDESSENNIIANNTQNKLILTDASYPVFFDEYNILREEFNNSEIPVSGEFNDNTIFIFDAVNVTIINDGTAVFNNGQVMTGNGATVVFDGLVFNNTLDAFVLESAGNTIKNTVINIDSDDEVHAIYVYDDNNIIQDTLIHITAPSANVIYNPDYSVNTPAPAAIVVSANNTLIDGVDIYFDGSEAIHNPDPTAWDAPTVDGIYLVSSNIPIENNTITDTSIEVIGCSYAYGINVGNAKNTKIEDIEVDVTSDYYADAIQLFDADKISITGKANAAAESEAYGVYSTAMGTGFSKNIDLTGLDITTVAAKATGVLIEGSANVTMADATYNIIGAETTAVRVAEDFMHNTPTNILIDNVEMDITGTEDNSVLDFYKADTVIITNNNIVSSRGSEILFNQTPNSQVVGNYIKINDVIFGNYAVITNENDTIIENNTPKSQKMDEMQQTIDELQNEIDKLKAPKETTLTIDEITDARYKDNVTISGTLVNEDSIGLFNQIVTLTIDGKEVNVTTKGGIFNYTTTFTQIGEKTVTATYAGTDKYQASEATTTFTVEKQDIIITYDPIQDAKYKDNITITGKITDVNGNGLNNINALITINGKLYKAKTDKTGAFTLTTTITEVGTNTVKFAYNGNTYYNGYETITTFNTEKQDIIITYDAIPDAKYKDTITITGKITDANGNGLYNINALIKINGKLYKAKTDQTGAFTLTTKANVTGTNNVNISYGGNTNYNGAETLTTFNVEKQDVTIECDTIPETVRGEDVTITGTVKDVNGYSVNNVNVNIRINGKLFKAKTDTTGAFTLTTTATTVGTNNVTLSYNGNANYNTAETITTFTVIAKA